ncbi:MAG: chromosomal replication initiator protein DnaA [Pseudomonadota bacterium]|nr:chromosomal replication initiator protein DnaA [Pseudomonadota bacterium]
MIDSPNTNTHSPCAIWETIKSEAEQKVSADEFACWFSRLTTASLGADKTLTVMMPNADFCREFTSRYLTLIEQCRESLGFGHIILRLHTATETASTGVSDRDTVAATDTEDIPSTKHSPTHQVFSKSLSEHSYLNADYSFNNFVRGPSNQFALASCESVANSPGRNYNPLFIYGFTGLGKTHLLHAIGNHVQSNARDAVITYISSERFMNELIYCISKKKMWEFRQKYRHCDILLVDDIQFISGKPSTQREFFHTFNSLYEEGKQIVLTSDQYPHDIPDIEDRLRNRFRWGLIADIQPPDTEHRIAILLNKSEQLGFDLSLEVAEYIAINTKRNVRELEGALHRIAAFSALQGTRISLNAAKDIFRNVFDDKSAEIGVETIQKVVANHFKIKVSDLKSKKRLRTISVPRQVAMYLCRTIGSASFADIGSRFGGKDHTTAMYACRKVEASRKDDIEIRTHIETLERELERRV